MTIGELQEHVRKAWTNETYSVEFNESKLDHKNISHALLHVVKASGKIAAMIDDADHGKGCIDDTVGLYLADLLICAARAANEQGLSLAMALDVRLAAKLPLPR